MSAESLKNQNKIAIKPRRMAFDMAAPINPFAFKNNSLISTFFYSLSAMFPDGERFFIHSVRLYRDDIQDPELQAQIRGFIGQEAHHGVSHEQLNDKIETLGFPMHKIVEKLSSRITFLKKLDRNRQLALTVAMEHFTASLAEFLLKNPDILDDVSPTIRQMLIWHAVEEIEHKSVAYDVYQKYVNNHWMRYRVMVIAVTHLFSRIALYQVMMLRAQKHWPSWREWREAFTFFWGKKGVLRDNIRGLRQFFARDFHPSDIDQSHLIEGWEQQHPDIAALQVN
ncbi:MAG: metal-dependent hydrolase [Oleibacter sp.]|nr:metal-dependent hydrolase [Thalassolituus sp.]